MRFAKLQSFTALVIFCEGSAKVFSSLEDPYAKKHVFSLLLQALAFFVIELSHVLQVCKIRKIQIMKLLISSVICLIPWLHSFLLPEPTISPLPTLAISPAAPKFSILKHLYFITFYFILAGLDVLASQGTAALFSSQFWETCSALIPVNARVIERGRPGGQPHHLQTAPAVQYMMHCTALKRKAEKMTVIPWKASETSTHHPIYC